jgi:hypothetical protein
LHDILSTVGELGTAKSKCLTIESVADHDTKFDLPAPILAMRSIVCAAHKTTAMIQAHPRVHHELTDEESASTILVAGRMEWALAVGCSSFNWNLVAIAPPRG